MGRPANLVTFGKLSPAVTSALAHRLEWREFRPAQTLLLEAVESGDNLLIMGPSGCGKSTAALLAAVDGLMKSPGRGPSVLYLTDSEADAQWMAELCQACGLLAHGISSTPVPRNETPDVIVLSPGRLEPELGKDWSRLRVVLLDSLLEVLPGPRGAHLNALLERLFHRCGSDPQRVALSTSLGDPNVALAWLSGGSRRPARWLRVPGAGGRRMLEIERIAEQMDLAAVATVKVRGRRALIELDSQPSFQQLQAGLERRGVRCAGQDADCRLSLGRASSGATFPQVVSLLPPGSVRDILAISAFTDREPQSVSRVCLATQSDEDFLAACAAVSLAGQRWVEPASPERAAWPVYLQQLFGRILAGNGITVQEALQDEGRPWAFQDLLAGERQQVLDHLLTQDILQHAAGHLVLGAKGEAEFDNALWRQTGKAFVKPSRYALEDGGGSRIGSVDSWLLQTSGRFRYRHDGRLWEIVDVRWKAGTATARPAKGGGGVCWHGPLRVYHRRLCEEMRALLVSDALLEFLEPRQQRALEQLRQLWRPWMNEPLGHRLPTFAGARVNGVIAKLHVLLTGEDAAFNNLLVEVAANGSGLQATLERLRDGLSHDDEQALTASCQRDKLLDSLPAQIRTSYLLSQMFEMKAARALAVAVLEARVSKTVPPVGTESDHRAETLTGDAFFQQLTELARTERTRNKWVFLPEVGLRWVLSERLLHSGVDWVNFRFLTPFQLALDLAAPSLIEARIHPKPEGLGPELMIRLLLQLPPGEGYFRPLADQGGMARPLWAAIQEVRMAGLTAADLAVEMFTTPAKGREIKALLAAYETYLEDQKLGDRATVFRAAHERIQEAPIARGDLVLEYPSKPWSLLERRFLDGLAGNAAPAWVTRADPPRRWPRLCSKQELRQRAVTQDSHLLGTLSCDQIPAPRSDGTLQFFCAGRRDAEIQEVLRRILARVTPLDQVEIVVHDKDSLALLWDKLHKHELAATFQEGLPVGATAPGRAVLGLLRWSEANFACFFLRELLMAGLLQPQEGCTPSTAARFLERSGATWGRDTYALHLNQLETRYRSLAQLKDLPADEAHPLQRQADDVATLSLWIQSLLQRWPVAEASGDLHLAALLDGLLSILATDVPCRSSLDRIAFASMTRALRDLKLLAESPWSVDQCHRLVREKLESLVVGAGRPEAGKLFVTSPLKMGRSGRSHLFLLGLETGSLQVDSAEDAILCDEERRKIDPTLALSTDRAAENVFLLAQQLAGLDAQVTLSYSCRDYRTGEELLPSRLFFDAARLLYPDIQDYDQLAEALGEPLSLAPATANQAAGDAEWWLTRLVGCGNESRGTVLTGFPWLSRGSLAQQARESLAFTPFDGWVPQAANLHDPRVTMIPISVSRLQDLAACPYRTFLRTALSVQPLELEQQDLDRWLSAAYRGTALHETFANYYRRLRAAGSRPVTEDLQILIELLATELEKVREVLPAPSLAVESRETEQLHRDLAHFLKLEVGGSREVIGCEVGFGMAETFDEPLATVTPVMIDLSQDVRFPLRGRIDRIDRLEGAYEVVDYKTGSQLSDSPRPYAQGELLQHALYALVVESLLAGQDGQVRASSYYFPVVRAKRTRVTLPYPDKAALASVLSLVLEPLRTGAFPHTIRSDKHCAYCDFRAACIAQSDQGMLAKYEQPENSMLDCRRRLRTIS